MPITRLLVIIGLLWLCNNTKALGLPPAEDIPEEVLRSEIVLEGRSPIDGKPLNAMEYTSITQGFREDFQSVSLDPKIQQLIFNLRLLRLFRTIIFF